MAKLYDRLAALLSGSDHEIDEEGYAIVEGGRIAHDDETPGHPVYLVLIGTHTDGTEMYIHPDSDYPGGSVGRETYERVDALLKLNNA
jgi:hypothetical protein